MFGGNDSELFGGDDFFTVKVDPEEERKKRAKQRKEAEEERRKSELEKEKQRLLEEESRLQDDANPRMSGPGTPSKLKSMEKKRQYLHTPYAAAQKQREEEERKKREEEARKRQQHLRQQQMRNKVVRPPSTSAVKKSPSRGSLQDGEGEGEAAEEKPATEMKKSPSGSKLHGSQATSQTSTDAIFTVGEVEPAARPVPRTANSRQELRREAVSLLENPLSPNTEKKKKQATAKKDVPWWEEVQQDQYKKTQSKLKTRAEDPPLGAVLEKSNSAASVPPPEQRRSPVRQTKSLGQGQMGQGQQAAAGAAGPGGSAGQRKLLRCKVCGSTLPFEEIKQHSAICRPKPPQDVGNKGEQQRLAQAKAEERRASQDLKRRQMEEKQKRIDSLQTKRAQGERGASRPAVQGSDSASATAAEAKWNVRFKVTEELQKALVELRQHLHAIHFEIPDFRPIKIGPVTWGKFYCRMAVFDKLVVVMKERTVPRFPFSSSALEREVVICSGPSNITFLPLPGGKQFEISSPALPHPYKFSVAVATEVDDWWASFEFLTYLSKSAFSLPEKGGSANSIRPSGNSVVAAPTPSGPAVPYTMASKVVEAGDGREYTLAGKAAPANHIPTQTPPRAAPPPPEKREEMEETNEDWVDILTKESKHIEIDAVKDKDTLNNFFGSATSSSQPPATIQTPAPVAQPESAPAVQQKSAVHPDSVQHAPAVHTSSSSSSAPPPAPPAPPPSSPPPVPPEELKMILVGSGIVGKTALASVYTEGVYPPDDQWIPSKVYAKDIRLGDRDCQLKVLDMAPDENREEFAQIFQDYMCTADCFLLVYCVTARETFDEASFFYNQIMAFREDNPSMALVGNMCDDAANRQVSFQEGEELGQSLNIKFYETSAKTRDSVDEVFRVLVAERLEQREVQRRQEEIERMLREQEEEERQREEDEQRRIREREEALLQEMEKTTEAREKDQNELIQEEMRQREAMKKAALESMGGLRY